MMGNPDEASDALQDALIGAYTKLQSFRGTASFSTWLYRIVVNTCLDALRQRKRAMNRMAPDGNSVVHWQAAGAHEAPKDSAARRDTMDAVYTAVVRLPEKIRNMIVLRDLEGFSYSEIAAQFGCPLATVKTRVYRGRMALRVLLASYRSPGTCAVESSHCL